MGSIQGAGSQPEAEGPTPASQGAVSLLPAEGPPTWGDPGGEGGWGEGVARREGREGGGGVFRWSLPLALPCGPCACSSSCLVALRFAVTSRRWRAPWGWGWVQLYSRLHGRCCCYVRRRRCGVRSVVVHLRVRSGLVSALLRRVGPWGRWSVWSLRLSGRWRLRWREGGQGGQLWPSGSAAGHPAAVGRRRMGRRLCVASCAGRTQPPSAAASTIRP